MMITEKQKEILGPLLLGLMVLAFFYPMLFMGKAIFHRDFHFITFPFRFFLSEAYHQGVIPYWTPSVYGGMPFMAAFHPGVFYPPSIVFFLQDTVLAINLFYGMHFLVLGVSLFLLGKLWGFSFAARLCSSFTGMLSGFMVGAVLLSNYFMAAVWLPLIFWTFLKFRQEKRIGYFIGTVLFIAIQTLAACPEISIMTVGLLYLHQLWLIPKGSGTSPYTRLTLSLGLAVLLALGLSALQLWPTAQLLNHSVRSGGMNFDIHSHWSLEIKQLATLVKSPVYFSEANSGELFIGFLHTLYMGLLTLVFLPVAILVRKEKAASFWLVIFAVGIILALGKSTPVYQYIYKAVPFLSLFRFPSKFFIVSSFAAVFILGYVLDYILSLDEDRRRKGIAVMSALLLSFGALVAVRMQFPFLETQTSLVILSVFGITFILYYFGKLRKPVFIGTVCVLIFMDLSLTSFRLLPIIDRSLYDEQPVLMKTLQGVDGKHRVYSGKVQGDPFDPNGPSAPSALHGMFLLKEYLTPYTGMVYGVENIGGQPGLGMGLNYQKTWIVELLKADPKKRLEILKRSNVKYWIDMDRPTQFDAEREPVISPDRVNVLADALPRAFLVPNMRVSEKDQILHTYFDASFDPRQEVLLREQVDFKPSANFAGQVLDVAYRPNHVTVKTVQEGNGFLVLLDSFFPGWTVKVDGEEQPILRANHFYRAVQLAPGEHVLEFEYFPEGFKAGLIVSAMSALLCCALFLFWGKLKPRENPGNASLSSEEPV